jgi:hypothetical protein
MYCRSARWAMYSAFSICSRHDCSVASTSAHSVSPASSAASGPAAAELLQRAAFDAITVSQSMQDGSGPEVLRAEAPFLITAILFYLAAVVFGFLKYHRLTSYHTWSSKALAILASIVVLSFFLGGPGWPFRVLAPLAVLSLLEEIAITALLSQWHANVLSLWHAWQIKSIKSRGDDRK